MNDSRERFEAWFEVEGRYLLANGNFRDAMAGTYQAAERNALERAAAFMEKRASEFESSDSHIGGTMARIYREEATSIRALAGKE